MGHFYRHVLTMCFSLAVIASAFAGDRLSVGTILERPADYQAKVVTASAFSFHRRVLQ
jgi:hypothetical protein